MHEYFHAFAACKLGDHTAKEQGRLTLNPLKHIDIIGFLFIVIAGFGWAKPVQFNPENLSRPRRDKAIIAAAGPFSNLVLALLFIALVKLWQILPDFIMSGGDRRFMFLFSEPAVKFISVVLQTAAINLGLFIFNLFPLPPLDGSHIVFSGLNLKAETERQIMRIGAPLLLVIILIQNRAGIDILPIGKLVSAILDFFLGA